MKERNIDETPEERIERERTEIQKEIGNLRIWNS